VLLVSLCFVHSASTDVVDEQDSETNFSAEVEDFEGNLSSEEEEQAFESSLSSEVEEQTVETSFSAEVEDFEGTLSSEEEEQAFESSLSSEVEEQGGAPEVSSEVEEQAVESRLSSEVEEQGDVPEVSSEASSEVEEQDEVPETLPMPVSQPKPKPAPKKRKWKKWHKRNDSILEFFVDICVDEHQCSEFDLVDSEFSDVIKAAALPSISAYSIDMQMTSMHSRCSLCDNGKKPGMNLRRRMGSEQQPRRTLRQYRVAMGFSGNAGNIDDVSAKIASSATLVNYAVRGFDVSFDL